MATETQSTGEAVTDAAHGAAEAVGACVDSHGGAIGMPQLCGEWMGNQIFWLVITLVVLYLILARVALPRIAAVLAERAGAITNDLARAEELKLKAVEAEAAYEKALAKARTEAQAIAAETKAQIRGQLAEATKIADAEIAEKTAGSEARITEIRDSALANVEIVAKDTAAAIAEAMGVKPGDADIDAAVKARLNGGAA